MRPVRAHYFIEEEDLLGERVVITDLDGPVSVTNDAEAVVAQLLEKGTIKPGGRLFYYDTSGDLDELAYDAGGFTGFRPGPSRA